MAYTQAQVNSQGSWSYTAPGATPTIPVWVVNPDAVSIVNRICTVGVTGDTDPTKNPLCQSSYGSGIQLSPSPGETQQSFLSRQASANAKVAPASTFINPVPSTFAPVVKGVSTSAPPSWLPAVALNPPPSLPPSAINTPLPSPMTPGATPSMSLNDGVTIPIVGTVNIWVLVGGAALALYLFSKH